MALIVKCRALALQLPCRQLAYHGVASVYHGKPTLQLESSSDFLRNRRYFTITPQHYSRKKNNSVIERAKDWLREARQGYDDAMERHAPAVKQYLDYLSNGLQHEWRNAKAYWRIRQKKNDDQNYRNTYKEEMIVYNMHRNVIKLAPLLPVFLLPFGFFLVFVPIYLFPRHVLPQTFWTARQRRQILTAIHKDRLQEFCVIVHHMNYHKNNTEDVELKKVLEDVCKTVGDGQVPKNNQILPLRRFCRQIESPFNGNQMVYILLRAFCFTIMVSPYQPYTWLRHRLSSNAHLVMSLDRLLQREKILTQLSPEELIFASLMRGLNSTQLSRDAQLYWMQNWISLTSQCDDGDVWFVLHAMVLLSSNYSELKFQRKVFN